MGGWGRWTSGKGVGTWSESSGVAPHSGHYVMSFSKTNLLPKSAGNTQEAVALSQHDCKIVYRDVKDQENQTNQQNTQHISCQVY